MYKIFNRIGTLPFSVQTATVGPADEIAVLASRLVSFTTTQSKPVSGQDPQALQETK